MADFMWEELSDKLGSGQNGFFYSESNKFMPTRQQEKMEICGGKSYMPCRHLDS